MLPRLNFTPPLWTHLPPAEQCRGATDSPLQLLSATLSSSHFSFAPVCGLSRGWSPQDKPAPEWGLHGPQFLSEELVPAWTPVHTLQFPGGNIFVLWCGLLHVVSLHALQGNTCSDTWSTFCLSSSGLGVCRAVSHLLFFSLHCLCSIFSFIHTFSWRHHHTLLSKCPKICLFSDNSIQCRVLRKSKPYRFQTKCYKISNVGKPGDF